MILYFCFVVDPKPHKDDSRSDSKRLHLKASGNRDAETATFTLGRFFPVSSVRVENINSNVSGFVDIANDSKADEEMTSNDTVLVSNETETDIFANETTPQYVLMSQPLLTLNDSRSHFGRSSTFAYADANMAVRKGKVLFQISKNKEVSVITPETPFFSNSQSAPSSLQLPAGSSKHLQGIFGSASNTILPNNLVELTSAPVSFPLQSVALQRTGVSLSTTLRDSQDLMTPMAQLEPTPSILSTTKETFMTDSGNLRLMSPLEVPTSFLILNSAPVQPYGVEASFVLSGDLKSSISDLYARFETLQFTIKQSQASDDNLIERTPTLDTAMLKHGLISSPVEPHLAKSTHRSQGILDITPETLMVPSTKIQSYANEMSNLAELTDVQSIRATRHGTDVFTSPLLSRSIPLPRFESPTTTTKLPEGDMHSQSFSTEWEEGVKRTPGLVVAAVKLYSSEAFPFPIAESIKIYSSLTAANDLSRDFLPSSETLVIQPTKTTMPTTSSLTFKRSYNSLEFSGLYEDDFTWRPSSVIEPSPLLSTYVATRETTKMTFSSEQATLSTRSSKMEVERDQIPFINITPRPIEPPGAFSMGNAISSDLEFFGLDQGGSSWRPVSVIEPSPLLSSHVDTRETTRITTSKQTTLSPRSFIVEVERDQIPFINIAPRPIYPSDSASMGKATSSDFEFSGLDQGSSTWRPVSVIKPSPLLSTHVDTRKTTRITTSEQTTLSARSDIVEVERDQIPFTNITSRPIEPPDSFSMGKAISFDLEFSGLDQSGSTWRPVSVIEPSPLLSTHVDTRETTRITTSERTTLSARSNIVDVERDQIPFINIAPRPIYPSDSASMGKATSSDFEFSGLDQGSSTWRPVSVIKPSPLLSTHVDTRKTTRITTSEQTTLSARSDIVEVERDQIPFTNITSRPIEPPDSFSMGKAISFDLEFSGLDQSGSTWRPVSVIEPSPLLSTHVDTRETTRITTSERTTLSARSNIVDVERDQIPFINITPRAINSFDSFSVGKATSSPGVYRSNGIQSSVANFSEQNTQLMNASILDSGRSHLPVVTPKLQGLPSLSDVYPSKTISLTSFSDASNLILVYSTSAKFSNDNVEIQGNSKSQTRRGVDRALRSREVESSRFSVTASSETQSLTPPFKASRSVVVLSTAKSFQANGSSQLRTQVERDPIALVTPKLEELSSMTNASYKDMDNSAFLLDKTRNVVNSGIYSFFKQYAQFTKSSTVQQKREEVPVGSSPSINNLYSLSVDLLREKPNLSFSNASVLYSTIATFLWRKAKSMTENPSDQVSSDLLRSNSAASFKVWVHKETRQVSEINSVSIEVPEILSSPKQSPQSNGLFRTTTVPITTPAKQEFASLTNYSSDESKLPPFAYINTSVLEQATVLTSAEPFKVLEERDNIPIVNQGIEHFASSSEILITKTHSSSPFLHTDSYNVWEGNELSYLAAMSSTSSIAEQSNLEVPSPSLTFKTRTGAISFYSENKNVPSTTRGSDLGKLNDSRGLVRASPSQSSPVLQQISFPAIPTNGAYSLPLKTLSTSLQDDATSVPWVFGNATLMASTRFIGGIAELELSPTMTNSPMMTLLSFKQTTSHTIHSTGTSTRPSMISSSSVISGLDQASSAILTRFSEDVSVLEPRTARANIPLFTSPWSSQPSLISTSQKATVPDMSLLNRLDHLDRSRGHQLKTPTPPITSVKANLPSNIVILESSVSDIMGASETVFSNGSASSVPLQSGEDLEVLPNIATDLPSKIIRPSKRRDPAVHSSQINVTSITFLSTVNEFTSTEAHKTVPVPPIASRIHAVVLAPITLPSYSPSTTMRLLMTPYVSLNIQGISRGNASSITRFKNESVSPSASKTSDTLQPSFNASVGKSVNFTSTPLSKTLEETLNKVKRKDKVVRALASGIVSSHVFHLAVRHIGELLNNETGLVHSVSRLEDMLGHLQRLVIRVTKHHIRNATNWQLPLFSPLARDSGNENLSKQVDLKLDAISSKLKRISSVLSVLQLKSHSEQANAVERSNIERPGKSTAIFRKERPGVLTKADKKHNRLLELLLRRFNKLESMIHNERSLANETSSSGRNNSLGLNTTTSLWAIVASPTVGYTGMIDSALNSDFLQGDTIRSTFLHTPSLAFLPTRLLSKELKTTPNYHMLYTAEKRISGTATLSKSLATIRASTGRHSINNNASSVPSSVNKLGPFSAVGLGKNKTGSVKRSKEFTYVTFRGGLEAGIFTDRGKVESMETCVELCYHHSTCNVAFMVGHTCYSIQCYSQKTCEVLPVDTTVISTRVVYLKDRMLRLPYTISGHPTATSLLTDGNFTIRNCAKNVTVLKNMTFVAGMSAGNYTDYGTVDSIQACSNICCSKKVCDAAFMILNNCFTIDCVSEKACHAVPSKSRKVNTSIVYFRKTLSKTQEPRRSTVKIEQQCSLYKSILEGVTFNGGMNAGNFTDHGFVDEFSLCIEKCCQTKNCDAAFMVQNSCYSVKCAKNKRRCLPVTARSTQFKTFMALRNISYFQSFKPRTISHGNCAQVGQAQNGLTFKRGIKAGTFTAHNKVTNMNRCLQECCSISSCNAAFMIGKKCFSVSCTTKEDCKTTPARKTNVITSIAFVNRTNNKSTNRSTGNEKLGQINNFTKSILGGHCDITDEKRNVNLTGGWRSGKFLRLPDITDMTKCTEACCDYHGCGAAMFIDRYCYNLICFKKSGCHFIGTKKAFMINKFVAVRKNLGHIMPPFKKAQITLLTTSKEHVNRSIFMKDVRNAKIVRSKTWNVEPSLSTIRNIETSDLSLHFTGSQSTQPTQARHQKSSEGLHRRISNSIAKKHEIPSVTLPEQGRLIPSTSSPNNWSSVNLYPSSTDGAGQTSSSVAKSVVNGSDGRNSFSSMSPVTPTLASLPYSVITKPSLSDARTVDSSLRQSPSYVRSLNETRTKLATTLISSPVTNKNGNDVLTGKSESYSFKSDYSLLKDFSNSNRKRSYACTHTFVFNNSTLRGGLTAGDVKNEGLVEGMEQCVDLCCKTLECNVALLINEKCYIVACTNKVRCEAIPVKERGSKTKVAYVARTTDEAELIKQLISHTETSKLKDLHLSETETDKAIENKVPSMGDLGVRTGSCIRSPVLRDARLKFGKQAGDFKSVGKVTSVDECVTLCCNASACNAIFMLGSRCHLVSCSNEFDCQTVEAKSEFYKPTVVYVARSKSEVAYFFKMIPKELLEKYAGDGMVDVNATTEDDVPTIRRSHLEHVNNSRSIESSLLRGHSSRFKSTVKMESQSSILIPLLQASSGLPRSVPATIIPTLKLPNFPPIRNRNKADLGSVNVARTLSQVIASSQSLISDLQSASNYEQNLSVVSSAQQKLVPSPGVVVATSKTALDSSNVFLARIVPTKVLGSVRFKESRKKDEISLSNPVQSLTELAKSLSGLNASTVITSLTSGSLNVFSTPVTLRLNVSPITSIVRRQYITGKTDKLINYRRLPSSSIQTIAEVRSTSVQKSWEIASQVEGPSNQPRKVVPKSPLVERSVFPSVTGLTVINSKNASTFVNYTVSKTVKPSSAVHKEDKSTSSTNSKRLSSVDSNHKVALNRKDLLRMMNITIYASRSQPSKAKVKLSPFQGRSYTGAFRSTFPLHSSVSALKKQTIRLSSSKTGPSIPSSSFVVHSNTLGYITSTSVRKTGTELKDSFNEYKREKIDVLNPTFTTQYSKITKAVELSSDKETESSKKSIRTTNVSMKPLASTMKVNSSNSVLFFSQSFPRTNGLLDILSSPSSSLSYKKIIHTVMSIHENTRMRLQSLTSNSFGVQTFRSRHSVSKNGAISSSSLPSTSQTRRATPILASSSSLVVTSTLHPSFNFFETLLFSGENTLPVVATKAFILQTSTDGVNDQFVSSKRLKALLNTIKTPAVSKISSRSSTQNTWTRSQATPLLQTKSSLVNQNVRISQLSPESFSVQKLFKAEATLSQPSGSNRLSATETNEYLSSESERSSFTLSLSPSASIRVRSLPVSSTALYERLNFSIDGSKATPSKVGSYLLEASLHLNVPSSNHSSSRISIGDVGYHMGHYEKGKNQSSSTIAKKKRVEIPHLEGGLLEQIKVLHPLLPIHKHWSSGFSSDSTLISGALLEQISLLRANSPRKPSVTMPPRLPLTSTASVVTKVSTSGRRPIAKLGKADYIGSSTSVTSLAMLVNIKSRSSHNQNYFPALLKTIHSKSKGLFIADDGRKATPSETFFTHHVRNSSSWENTGHPLLPSRSESVIVSTPISSSLAQSSILIPSKMSTSFPTNTPASLISQKRPGPHFMKEESFKETSQVVKAMHRPKNKNLHSAKETTLGDKGGMFGYFAQLLKSIKDILTKKRTKHHTNIMSNSSDANKHHTSYTSMKLAASPVFLGLDSGTKQRFDLSTAPLKTIFSGAIFKQSANTQVSTSQLTSTSPTVLKQKASKDLDISIAMQPLGDVALNITGIHKATLCKHSKVNQNSTLRGGIHAGLMREIGKVNSDTECISQCCFSKTCDVAFLLLNRCFLISCKKRTLCESVPAKTVKFSPRLIYVQKKEMLPKESSGPTSFESSNNDFQNEITLTSHRSKISSYGISAKAGLSTSIRVLTDGKQGHFCETSVIEKNVTLRGGIKSGQFTDQGTIENMQRCIELCCSRGNCSVAFMLLNRCFSVSCYNDTLCTSIPARSLVFQPQLAFIRGDSHSEVLPSLQLKKISKLQVSSSKFFSTSELRRKENTSRVVHSQENCRYGNAEKQMTLRGGLNAGSFLEIGVVANIEQCVNHCCHTTTCDVAFMITKRCFLVKCYSSRLCESIPVRNVDYLTQIVHMSRDETAIVRDLLARLVKPSSPSFNTRNDLKSSSTSSGKAYENGASLKVIAQSAGIQGSDTSHQPSKPSGIFSGLRMGSVSPTMPPAVPVEGALIESAIEPVNGNKLDIAELIQTKGISTRRNNTRHTLHKTITPSWLKENPPLSSSRWLENGGNVSLKGQKLVPAGALSEDEICQSAVVYYNATMRGGINAGIFKDQGPVQNMRKCIEQCCRWQFCSVAFMLLTRCYIIACYNDHLCDPVPARNVTFTPRIAFISRVRRDQGDFTNILKNIATPSPALLSSAMERSSALFTESRLPLKGDQLTYSISQSTMTPSAKSFLQSSEIYPSSTQLLFSKLYTPKVESRRSCWNSELKHNVTLRGGLNAGRFKDNGKVESVEQCVDFCCRNDHCDLALMLFENCFTVTCHNKYLCDSVPAKTGKYKSRIVYVEKNGLSTRLSTHHSRKSLSLLNAALPAMGGKSEIQTNISSSSGLKSEQLELLLRPSPSTAGYNVAIRSTIYLEKKTSSTFSTAKNITISLKHNVRPTMDSSVSQNQHQITPSLSSKYITSTSTVSLLSLPVIVIGKSTPSHHEPFKSINEEGVNSGQIPGLAKTSKNSSLLSFAHPSSCLNSPISYNVTLRNGIRSGYFRDQGRVENMGECLHKCCTSVDCDVSFMLKRRCYLVTCYTKKGCETVPARHSLFNPRVAHVQRTNVSQLMSFMDEQQTVRHPRTRTSIDHITPSSTLPVPVKSHSHESKHSLKTRRVSGKKETTRVLHHLKGKKHKVKTNKREEMFGDLATHPKVEHVTVAPRLNESKAKRPRKNRQNSKQENGPSKVTRVQRFKNKLEKKKNEKLSSKDLEQLFRLMKRKIKKSNRKISDLASYNNTETFAISSMNQRIKPTFPMKEKNVTSQKSHKVADSKSASQVKDLLQEEGKVTKSSPTIRVKTKSNGSKFPENIYKSTTVASGHIITQKLKSKKKERMFHHKHEYLTTKSTVPSLPTPTSNLQQFGCTAFNVEYNRTLRGGLSSGLFHEVGKVNDIKTCTRHCCKSAICDLAFMILKHCFLVTCSSSNTRLCESTPALATNFNPIISRISRGGKDHVFATMKNNKPAPTVKPTSLPPTPSPKRPVASKSKVTGTMTSKSEPRPTVKQFSTPPRATGVGYNSSLHFIARLHSSLGCAASSTEQNVTLRGGLHAGKFLDAGKVNESSACTELCCKASSCDVAFYAFSRCFLVTCFDEFLCSSTPSLLPNFNPTVTHVYRRHSKPTRTPATTVPAINDVFQAIENNTEPKLKHDGNKKKTCKHSEVFDDVTLRMGYNAGNFTSRGKVNRTSQCVEVCCKQSPCDLIFMFLDNCFTVSCKSGYACGIVPARRSHFKPKIVYFQTNNSRTTIKPSIFNSTISGVNGIEKQPVNVVHYKEVPSSKKNRNSYKKDFSLMNKTIQTIDEEFVIDPDDKITTRNVIKSTGNGVVHMTGHNASDHSSDEISRHNKTKHRKKNLEGSGIENTNETKAETRMDMMIKKIADVREENKHLEGEIRILLGNQSKTEQGKTFPSLGSSVSESIKRNSTSSLAKKKPKNIISNTKKRKSELHRNEITSNATKRVVLVDTDRPLVYRPTDEHSIEEHKIQTLHGKVDSKMHHLNTLSAERGIKKQHGFPTNNSKQLNSTNEHFIEERVIYNANGTALGLNTTRKHPNVGVEEGLESKYGQPGPDRDEDELDDTTDLNIDIQAKPKEEPVLDSFGSKAKDDMKSKGDDDFQIEKQTDSLKHEEKVSVKSRNKDRERMEDLNDQNDEKEPNGPEEIKIEVEKEPMKSRGQLKINSPHRLENRTESFKQEVDESRQSDFHLDANSKSEKEKDDGFRDESQKQLNKPEIPSWIGSKRKSKEKIDEFNQRTVLKHRSNFQPKDNNAKQEQEFNIQSSSPERPEQSSNLNLQQNSEKEKENDDGFVVENENQLKKPDRLAWMVSKQKSKEKIGHLNQQTISKHRSNFQVDQPENSTNEQEQEFNIERLSRHQHLNQSDLHLDENRQKEKEKDDGFSIKNENRLRKPEIPSWIGSEPKSKEKINDFNQQVLSTHRTNFDVDQPDENKNEQEFNLRNVSRERIRQEGKVWMNSGNETKDGLKSFHEQVVPKHGPDFKFDSERRKSDDYVSKQGGKFWVTSTHTNKDHLTSFHEEITPTDKLHFEFSKPKDNEDTSQNEFHFKIQDMDNKQEGKVWDTTRNNNKDRLASFPEQISPVTRVHFLFGTHGRGTSKSEFQPEKQREVAGSEPEETNSKDVEKISLQSKTKSASEPQFSTFDSEPVLSNFSQQDVLSSEHNIKQPVSLKNDFGHSIKEAINVNANSSFPHYVTQEEPKRPRQRRPELNAIFDKISDIYNRLQDLMEGRSQRTKNATSRKKVVVVNSRRREEVIPTVPSVFSSKPTTQSLKRISKGRKAVNVDSRRREELIPTPPRPTRKTALSHEKEETPVPTKKIRFVKDYATDSREGSGSSWNHHKETLMNYIKTIYSRVQELYDRKRKNARWRKKARLIVSSGKGRKERKSGKKINRSRIARKHLRIPVEEAMILKEMKTIYNNLKKMYHQQSEVQKNSEAIASETKKQSQRSFIPRNSRLQKPVIKTSRPLISLDPNNKQARPLNRSIAEAPEKPHAQTTGMYPPFIVGFYR